MGVLIVFLFIAFWSGVSLCTINVIQQCFMVGGSYRNAIVGFIIALVAYVIYKGIELYLVTQPTEPYENSETPREEKK